MAVRATSNVWLLGASTGGLQAVTSFLRQIPRELDVAFVYVQHIDGQQLGTLRRIIEDGSRWPVREACTSNYIQAGTVTLIPPQHETRIGKQGQLLRFTSPWRDTYAPSINQIAKRMALVYQRSCGAIIFTGMGDDGVKGCREIRNRGGRVWVQDPAQCMAVSMPQAIIKSGLADRVASLDELASALVARYIALEEVVDE